MKRLFDMALAGTGLIASSPLWLLFGAAIKLEDGGPVFFTQERVGLRGGVFNALKFRSMRPDAESGIGAVQATEGDPRVTKIGKLMRATAMDELPQLFNVLDGSMSLVGPRPHANAHNELYRSLIEGYMLRHKVKPGITGLAQVNGYRGETETLEKMEQRVACDHQYIREWSLWMDLKILARTLGVVFSQKNAY